MKLIKTHKIANKKKGMVEFGSMPGGKWMFNVGGMTRGYIKLTKVPGGGPVAEKIAEAIHKSWLRTEGKAVKNVCERIDAICRRTMDRLLRVPTLADYKPKNASWDNPNTPAAGQDVAMLKPETRSEETVPWHLPPKGISAEDLEVNAPALPVVAIEPELAAK